MSGNLRYIFSFTTLVTTDYIVYYLVHLLNHVAIRPNVKINISLKLAQTVPLDFFKIFSSSYISLSASPNFHESDTFWLYGLLFLGFLSTLLALLS